MSMKRIFWPKPSTFPRLVFVLGLILLLAVLVAAYFLKPTIIITNRIPSPDKRWIASIESIDYVSALTPPSEAIILEPVSGIFKTFWRKRVFEIECCSQIETVVWRDNTLSITVKGTKKNILLQLPNYEDINISYKVQS